MQRLIFIFFLSSLCGSVPAIGAPRVGPSPRIQQVQKPPQEQEIPQVPPIPQLSADTPVVIDDASGITMEQAVTLALRDNPELSAFRKTRAVAEGEIRTATTLNNPTLQLQLLHAQDSTQLGWGALLKWMPPQPVTYLAKRGQARAQLEEAGQQIAEMEWALTAQVRSVFATLLELREQTRVATGALDVRRRVVGLVRIQVQRGRATRIEQNAAEIALLDGQREVDDLELRTTQAQLRLRALLGMVGLTPLPLKGTIAAGDSLPGNIDPEQLAERAIAARPALKAAQARVTRRQQTVRLENSRRAPWFELSGRYRMNNSQRFPHDVQLGIETALPILDQNSGPVMVAKAELEREQALVVALVQSVKQSVYAASGELLIRRKILLRSRREVLPILLEHERLLEAAARGAAIDLVALLASEQSILRGRRQHSEARLGYEQALITLQAAVGVPAAELFP